MSSERGHVDPFVLPHQAVADGQGQGFLVADHRTQSAADEHTAFQLPWGRVIRLRKDLQLKPARLDPGIAQVTETLVGKALAAGKAEQPAPDEEQAIGPGCVGDVGGGATIEELGVPVAPPECTLILPATPGLPRNSSMLT